MSDSNPILLFEQLYEQKVAALKAEYDEQVAALKKKHDAALFDWLLDIERRLKEKLRHLGHHHHHHRHFVLLQPTLTDLETGEPLMAAYPLKLNKVAHFVLTLTNASGGLDPVDPSDVFTVTSSDPTNLQAVIGQNASGQTEVAVSWLHTTDPMLTGVGISLTDSAGNTADNAETFDMVAPDHVPDQIGIDTAAVTETDQPVPV